MLVIWYGRKDISYLGFLDSILETHRQYACDARYGYFHGVMRPRSAYPDSKGVTLKAFLVIYMYLFIEEFE